jgi:hypothetical protein
VYLLRLSEPDDLARVCEFFRRVHVDARPRPDGTVSVAVPGAASPLHERRELTGYITTWNALNPGSSLELVEER